MVSFTGAFKCIVLSFPNILNCCSPFDSNNLVSAMIIGSNRTGVSSILVNSPSLKGLQVKLLYSFAASSKKRFWNDNVSSSCFLVALDSSTSSSSPSYNSFSNPYIIIANSLLQNSHQINLASSVRFTKWVSPATSLMYALFCSWI